MWLARRGVDEAEFARLSKMRLEECVGRVAAVLCCVNRRSEGSEYLMTYALLIGMDVVLCGDVDKPCV
jgi:hypothetical protein